jgi:hypothetical protein
MDNFMTILTLFMDASQNSDLKLHITSWKEDKYLFEAFYKGIVSRYELSKIEFDSKTFSEALEIAYSFIRMSSLAIRQKIIETYPPKGWVFD